MIILQCKGQIDSCIGGFVELVLGRLMKEVHSSELRTMCLQVVIAALYYNPHLLIQTLDKMQGAATEPIAAHFIRQWLHDTDCFLGIHDRKLYVLGLCSAMSMGDAKPPIMNELAATLLPSLMVVFDGLKRAYHARAQEEEESDEDEEDDDEDCDGEALSSDEDELDELGPSYLGNVKNFATKKAAEMGIEMSAELKVDFFKSILNSRKDVKLFSASTNRTTMRTTPMTTMIQTTKWTRRLWRVTQLRSTMRKWTTQLTSSLRSNKC